MLIEKLLEIEAAQEFEDVNAIRRSHVHSFMDEWVVTDLLGRGSFGNVYRIVKPQPGIKNHECALKICQVNNPEDAELISQEIRMQMTLSGHPNAVQIEDYAFISREPPRVSYLLIRMELLSPLPADGLSERETIQLGIDICSVLEKCVSMEPKLVHCDIKPANILVSSDGRYKLGDFGTAKTLQATMTYTGNRGTPLYMAPEVALYSGYDSRCDIFSLGYTMLTMLNGGQHPFQNGDEKTDDVLRTMYEAKKRPQIKGVSTSLMKIIGKMCEPRLHARSPRASEIKHDLESLVRKKEEAEKIARLEAERQAEIERKKARDKRNKNLKAAEDAVSRAEHAASAARHQVESILLHEKPKAEKKARELEAQAERMRNVQRYVLEGATYDDAVRRVKEEEAERAEIISHSQTEPSSFVKKLLSGGAAVLTVIAAVLCVGVLLHSSASTEDMPASGVPDTLSQENDRFPSSGDEHIQSYSSVSLSDAPDEFESEPELTPLVPYNTREITGDGLILGAATDGQGYRVMGHKNSDISSIIIPAEYNGIPVIEIGSEAFFNKNNKYLNLKEVIIPDTINVIGDYAFRNCRAITKISIPDGVTHIGDGAFYWCRYLEEITIPDSVEYIGESAFRECQRLKEIAIPDGVSSIESHTFSCCTYLKKVSIPDSVTAIGSYAFYNCKNLEKAYIPDGVTFIGQKTFYQCQRLSEVSLPQGITSIEDSTFYECISLKEINLPHGVTAISDYAFCECRALESITIPDGVITIGSNAFTNCLKLTNISIPDSVTSIGKKTFSYCSALTIHAPYEASYYGSDLGKYKEWIIEQTTGN